MDNEYLKDAAFFLRKTSAAIEEDMKKEIIIDALLFFALGMERILKGILFNLNPVYVYKIQDFKNTVSLLYKKSLLPSHKKNKEISQKPDADVLSFKRSLIRAKSISITTEKNTSLLFLLSNLRDTIAHNKLSDLNLQKSKTLLLRDFYPLIKDFSDELNQNITRFLGSYKIRLSSISAKHQESIEDKVKMKLDSHKMRWEQLKTTSGFIEKMKAKTELIYQSSKNVDVTDCPACDNTALLTVEVDYDYSEGQVRPMGIFASQLKCLFCKLLVLDYDEIDYLKLNDLLIPEQDF